MALYIIIGHDVPDSLELRKQFRPAHLERLTQLDEQHRLIIAGPTPCLLYTSPSPRDRTRSRMPSSA